MLESAISKETIRIRRDYRDMELAGYEYVGERGVNLWELYRGWRYDHKIVEAVIAADGRGIWVKTQPRSGSKETTREA